MQHPEFAQLLKDQVCPLIIKLFAPNHKQMQVALSIHSYHYPVFPHLFWWYHFHRFGFVPNKLASCSLPKFTPDKHLNLFDLDHIATSMFTKYTCIIRFHFIANALFTRTCIFSNFNATFTCCRNFGYALLQPFGLFMIFLCLDLVEIKNLPVPNNCIYILLSAVRKEETS